MHVLEREGKQGWMLDTIMQEEKEKEGGRRIDNGVVAADIALLVNSKRRTDIYCGVFLNAFILWNNKAVVHYCDL
jgi:hypothetical protein